MADKMATMFGDVTDHRQPHHPWNIPLNHDTREAGDIATFKKLIKGRRGGGGGGGKGGLLISYLYLVVLAWLSPVNNPKLYVQVLLDFLCLTGFCLFVLFFFTCIFIHLFRFIKNLL